MIFLNIAGVIGTPFDSLFCWMDLASISFALSSESSPKWVPYTFQCWILTMFTYVAICSNSGRSFLICSIWMIHHSPYYSIWLNSNWIFSISFPPKHSFMVTLYLSNHSNWVKSNWMFFRLVNFAKNALSQKKCAVPTSQVSGNLYDIIPGKKRREREK